MITGFKDPAPSKFVYKLNRLAYRLWFKLLLSFLTLSALILITRIFIFEKVDFNKSFLSIKDNTFSFFEGVSEYKVNNVEISGASEKLVLEIKDLVNNTLSGKISRLRVSNLREKIIEIARVKNAFVKLTMNGNIIVKVIERKALVVFFDGKIYVLLDKDGVRISSYNDWKLTPNLPLIVGKGADTQLLGFKKLYSENLQSLIPEIEFYEWVGERRWNLHLKNKLVIKLPEKNLQKGLNLLSFLRERNFFNNNRISVIDLRHLDRPFIRFTDNLTAKAYSHIL